jgi:hypothetical protein
MRQTDLLGKTFRGVDMPFSESEKNAIQVQSLRAVISANWSFWSFKNPEVVKLFWIMRSAAPDILPSGKVVGGKLPNDAAAKVESKLDKVLNGKHVGLKWVGLERRLHENKITNSSPVWMGGSLAPKVQLTVSAWMWITRYN